MGRCFRPGRVLGQQTNALAKERGVSEDRLLGFDARELWMDTGLLWDVARRARFLLRPEAPKPLSVDPLVWPASRSRHTLGRMPKL